MYIGFWIIVFLAIVGGLAWKSYDSHNPKCKICGSRFKPVSEHNDICQQCIKKRQEEFELEWAKKRHIHIPYIPCSDNADPEMDISKFNKVMSEYHKSYRREGYIAACDAVLEMIPSINDSYITAIIMKEGECHYPDYYHKLYGYLWNDKPYSVSLQRSVQQSKDREIKRLAAAKEYISGFEAIPRVPVVIDPDANNPTSHSTADMPDISYTNVTARFNRGKFPNFVVIDTETNGLRIQGGRIIELSAIRYESFHPVAAWTTLINPGQPIPAEASAINHITDEMVASAPGITQISKSFLDFVGNDIIVGYNLPFDLRFLYSRGIDVVSQNRRFYDVLTLSKKAFKDDLSRFRLADVAEHCGVEPDNTHRSLADCYTTGLVFDHCIWKIIAGGTYNY